MSNLGGYQLLTTFAKKVGGPRNLVALIAGGGAIIGGLAVKGGERLWNKVKSKENKSDAVYTIMRDAKSNEGVFLRQGDKYRVLETDEDAVLIDLIKNENNPYFVSRYLLENISNYNKNSDK